MKNNIMYFISLLVISCLISVFISYIFISNRETIEPISISINISDTNSNIEESFVTKSIEENINKLYDRSISNLNTSILLFSTCLGIFTILFGVFYISKINEIQKEMNDIDNFIKMGNVIKNDTIILYDYGKRDDITYNVEYQCIKE